MTSGTVNPFIKHSNLNPVTWSGLSQVSSHRGGSRPAGSGVCAGCKNGPMALPEPEGTQGAGMIQTHPTPSHCFPSSQHLTLSSACRPQTALQIAAATNQHLIVRDLLAHGAQINTRDLWGRSPLHVCAEKGHLQSLQVRTTLSHDVIVKNQS